MSEKVTTFCDRCNPEQVRLESGRGYVDATPEIAREDFDWTTGLEGDICVECQDEAEENANG